MSALNDTELAEQSWLDGWRAGPQRLRWDRIPLQVGDAAPDLSLLDYAGEPQRLSSFWNETGAVILFWRHFGCSCGRDRAARLIAETARYRELGVSVVVIGQAGPERAAAYRELTAIDWPLLCDPDREAYRAFDVLEGTPAQVLFDAPDAYLQCDVAAGESLAAERHATDRALVDSPWQLPAEFVIAPNGQVQLAYRYQYCEDWPDERVLTSAVRFGGAPTLS
jgi:peroxiredoxin